MPIFHPSCSGDDAHAIIAIVLSDDGSPLHQIFVDDHVALLIKMMDGAPLDPEGSQRLIAAATSIINAWKKTKESTE